MIPPKKSMKIGITSANSTSACPCAPFLRLIELLADHHRYGRRAQCARDGRRQDSGTIVLGPPCSVAFEWGGVAPRRSRQNPSRFVRECRCQNERPALPYSGNCLTAECGECRSAPLHRRDRPS